jgi:hypothetical protein
MYLLIYNIPDRLSTVIKYNRKNLGFGAFFVGDMPALWTRRTNSEIETTLFYCCSAIKESEAKQKRLTVHNRKIKNGLFASSSFFVESYSL